VYGTLTIDPLQYMVL